MSIGLLVEAKLPIKETAYWLSFDNPYYFSRLLKIETGMTPDTMFVFLAYGVASPTPTMHTACSPQTPEEVTHDYSFHPTTDFTLAVVLTVIPDN